MEFWFLIKYQTSVYSKLQITLTDNYQLARNDALGYPNNHSQSHRSYHGSTVNDIDFVDSASYELWLLMI
ncbi:uncharacterized protein Smp_203960 [Schistosoma mansoni]|uniref:uncharacterized protein n=1 Tax=Schistosoma mansoni TaxID=6183 RepID=UPI00022DCB8D|nr:uncharacterized protein Smp_203960 [Schistosoma mansoni]|eukprot:XP_018655466.1 uncharacterized protein Smp_203960 [Schistosoma mansoni]